MDRREKESSQPKNERTLDSQKNKETSLSILRSPAWDNSQRIIMMMVINNNYIIIFSSMDNII